MRKPDDGTANPGATPSALATALAWLRHPVSIVAIAVLVLNDHVLKAEFSTWWTGKLSDVAGLVFAPALLAVALAAVARLARHPDQGRAPRPETVAAASLAIVGILFVAVKATAVGAGTASALLTRAIGPSLIRTDTADLLTLPALAIAWLTFRACLRRPDSPSRPKASRLGAALLIGAATAATLATSYIGVIHPLAVSVIPDGDGLVVKYQEAHQFSHISADRTSDGVTWQTVCESLSTNECGGSINSGAPSITMACVPSDSDVCFRVQDGRIGVDRSDDAGSTWRPEWGLTDAERDLLIAFREVDRPDTQLSSLSLGIVDRPSGFVVIVANGYDGLAVRAADGSWERRGFLDSDCCSGGGPPLDVTKSFETIPGMAPGLAVTMAAWGFAFAITLLVTHTRAGTQRRRGFGTALAATFRWIGGGLLMASGLLLCSSWVTVAARTYPASPERLNDGGVFMVALVICVTAIGVVMIGAGSEIVPLSPSRQRRRAMLGAAIAATVGTVAALVAGSAWSEWRPVAAVAGTAVLVALVPAIVVVRGRTSHDRQPSADALAIEREPL